MGQDEPTNPNERKQCPNLPGPPVRPWCALTTSGLTKALNYRSAADVVPSGVMDGPVSVQFGCVNHWRW